MICNANTQYISLRLFTDNSGLEVHEDSPGNMFSSAGLTEERVERVIPAADGLVAGHLSVRLDAVLQTVELPAGIANLDAGLTNVDTDTLTLKWKTNFEITVTPQRGMAFQLTGYPPTAIACSY